MKTSILLSALTLTGCSMLADFQEKQIDTVRGSVQSSDVISIENVKPENFQDLIEESVDSRTVRNEKQSQLLVKSEINCSKFIKSAHFNRAAMNIGLGIYSNIASTAAAIVSGRAGQNLAGLSSVLGYTGDTINQELYNGVLMPALLREISESRKNMLAEINSLQRQEIDTYPYPLALMDAIQYHNLCSIPVALMGLVNKTSVVQQLDYSAEITSIDSEIDKQTALLKDSTIGLSKVEQETLRRQIMDLTKRRELMMLSLPHIKIQRTTKDPEQTSTTKQEASQ